MKTFADRLRYAMAQAGVNQIELAERSGCTKSAISQYLSGRNQPGTIKLLNLANALDVAPELLNGTQALPVVEAPLNVNKISVSNAARCLCKSAQFVRVGLQRGRFPFGTAFMVSGSRRAYYINPYQFRQYVGLERFNEFFGVAMPCNQ